MKSINKMAVAALLALSCAGVASAQTIVHVTGSTAYRVADVTAECAYLGTGTTAVSFGNGYNSTSTSTSTLTGANYSIVYGPGSGSSQTIFENYFNGSIAGDEALVDGKTTLAFPKASAYTGGTVTQGSAATGTAATTTSNLAAYTAEDLVAPDVAFSDVTFDTADQIIEASSDTTTTQPQNTKIVGIVPFVFVCNGTSDVTDLAGLSMDPQKFTYTWSSGASTTLSFFTGVNSDEAVTVFPLGRDVDSGTRATALAETGYGLNGSGIVGTPVSQYYPYANSNDASIDQASGTFSSTTGVCGVDSTATTIGDIDQVPAESIDGYPMPQGDGGYYSGGNLAKGISTPFVSGTTGEVMMTYLGVSDAKTALTGTHPATLMAYNGVTFLPYYTTQTAAQIAANASKIYEGEYTFWGYEHENYKTSVATAATGVANALTGGLDTLSSNGVTSGSMKVSRSDDGQNIQ
jgi:hypothetical protein